MNIDTFSRQVEVMQGRLARLLDQAQSAPDRARSLAPNAFKELGVVSEELQVAVEELQQQNFLLEKALKEADRERQRYQELFEFSPEPYFNTTLEGIFQEANQMAARFFNLSSRSLIGKSLLLFVNPSSKSQFHAALLHHQHNRQPQDWNFVLVHQQELINVRCTTSAIVNQVGKTIGIRWLIHQTSTFERTESNPDSYPQDGHPQNGHTQNGHTQNGHTQNGHTQNGHESIALTLNRPRHHFERGELIPLKTHSLWFIIQGLVKLTTVAEDGKEILLGLIGPEMPFGINLTELPIYQAVALSTVEVVSVALDDISDSPQMLQTIATKINNRLKKTEALLAISGRRQTRDRLYQLLQPLKDEVGQPVSNGIRLGVRLTHEDLASACCSTRVTITRLLGQLQQQGVITYDTKSHIVMLNAAAKSC